MERLDQGHIHSKREVPRLTCLSRESNPGLRGAVGGEHSSQELLKVLSSKMDPAKVKLIKERGVEVFWKNPPVPHPVIALKSYSAISYSKHRSDCAFCFTSYKDWQIREEKIQYQLPVAK
jgi:hypothetical protein